MLEEAGYGKISLRRNKEVAALKRKMRENGQGFYVVSFAGENGSEIVIRLLNCKDKSDAVSARRIKL